MVTCKLFLTGKRLFLRCRLVDCTQYTVAGSTLREPAGPGCYSPDWLFGSSWSCAGGGWRPQPVHAHSVARRCGSALRLFLRFILFLCSCASTFRGYRSVPSPSLDHYFRIIAAEVAAVTAAVRLPPTDADALRFLTSLQPGMDRFRSDFLDGHPWTAEREISKYCEDIHRSSLQHFSSNTSPILKLQLIVFPSFSSLHSSLINTLLLWTLDWFKLFNFK